MTSEWHCYHCLSRHSNNGKTVFLISKQFKMHNLFRKWQLRCKSSRYLTYIFFGIEIRVLKVVIKWYLINVYNKTVFCFAENHNESNSPQWLRMWLYIIMLLYCNIDGQNFLSNVRNIRLLTVLGDRETWKTLWLNRGVCKMIMRDELVIL